MLMKFRFTPIALSSTSPDPTPASSSPTASIMTSVAPTLTSSSPPSMTPNSQKSSSVNLTKVIAGTVVPVLSTLFLVGVFLFLRRRNQIYTVNKHLPRGTKASVIIPPVSFHPEDIIGSVQPFPLPSIGEGSHLIAS